MMYFLRYFSLCSIQLLLLGECAFDLSPAVCYSQSLSWQRTNGPYGGRVFLIAVAPKGSLLAGVENCGIFRSTDDGDTWLETSLTTETIECFTTDQQGRLYVGPYSASGVFVSDDDGLNWSKSNTGLQQDGALSLAVSTQGRILAGTFYHGVFLSTNRGSQWTPVPLKLPQNSTNPVWSMCADSAGNVYAGVAGVGLFRSSDEGTSWTLTGFQNEDIFALTCLTRRNVFAGTGDRLYVSTDNGSTWQLLLEGTGYVHSIVRNKLGTISLFADNGVFQSIDEGHTWRNLNPNLAASLGQGTPRILHGAISANGSVHAGTDGEGIFRSSDEGNTWLERNSGLLGNAVWDLASTNTGLMLAGTDRGLYVTIDKGETWTHAPGLPGLVSSLAVVRGTIVFAVTSGGVYRSTDETRSWQRVDKGFEWTYMYTICADSLNNVYAGTSFRQLYRSTDLGDTWNLAAELGHSIYALACSPQGDVFAGTFIGGMYRSTDKGISWSLATKGVPAPHNDTTITMISVLRDGDVLAGNPFGQLFRSTDKGYSWKIVIDTAGPVRSVVQDGNGVVYAGFGNRVLFSSNQGTTWNVSGNNPSRTVVRALEFDRDNHLFAGLTYGGVYRSTTSIPTKVPSQYLVSQNYPNPFNSSTIIEFSNIELQRVELKVYSLLGQEVATLVSGQLARGNYEVRWNAPAAASGVYFYRLQAGEFVETKKMILIK
jgi:photosystem II stability/assembly factor-like uncharacterized protein